MAKKKKKGLFSKIIVSAVILLNVIFTIATLNIFRETSCEPSTLIVSWFGFTTGELWCLSKITREKEKQNDY